MATYSYHSEPAQSAALKSVPAVCFCGEELQNIGEFVGICPNWQRHNMEDERMQDYE